MKVLYITPSLGAGGAERQASILLPALRVRGVDVRALALDSGGPLVEPLRAAGVPVEVANMRHRFDFVPLMRSRLVRQFAPDVIVSRGVSGLYVGHSLAQWRHAAHVYNDHRGVGVELSRRRRAMIELLACRLSSVIVVSQEQCVGWLDLGCPRERIAIIPNGVQIRDAVPARDEVRRELALADGAVVAMIIASLRQVKRVPDFVRAVRRAREHCPELVGLVVGDGPERDSVIRAAGGDPAIRMLGHRDDVPRILQAADLVAITSAHEAMPMAILEAMAAGLPVVATNVGGIGKLVVDGDTGLLVRPGDPEGLAEALRRLARERNLRRRMGRAAHARCRERWSAEKMTDSYLEALTQAAAGRDASAPPASRLARRFVKYVDRKGWVTWERVQEDANVLVVVNVWPEPGAPARAPFLHSMVRALDAAGVKADLLYLRGYKGAHCYLLGCATMALLPLAKPGKYRLVHSHAGETALAARFFWAGPVLGTYWGSDLQGLGGQGDLRLRVRFGLGSRILRLHAVSMTATTTKSKQMENLLPRRARRRNRVIPDGVDTSRFRPLDRLEARAALGWPQGEPTIISVGRRSPVKRVWLAEQASVLAAREIAGLRWRAISDVSPDEMPLYYNAADLLLHAAASEGSPNVIKEAMACNLPVLATPAGDIPELLKDVEVSAACEARPEALAREAVRLLRAGRRSNGRERIAPLALEAATEQTLDCYRALGVPVPSTP